MKIVYGNTSFKALCVNVAVLRNLDLEPFGKRVYNRRADAVKTAGYLVARAAELTACVEHCQYNRNCRNTASVVAYAYNIAGQYFSYDMCADACQRLVD